MASENYHFIAVNFATVECSFIGQDFLSLHDSQFVNVNFGQLVREIIMNSPCITTLLPPKI